MFKLVTLLSSAILLQSCATSSANKPDQAAVTSIPSGAIVYANELKLGVTPLQYKLYEAFPAGWTNTSYQAQGVLTLKKEGCEDFTLRVNDYLISKPIHADLKCNKNYNKTKQKASLSETKKRLEKVETLYKNKLISKEEHKATRERILNEL